MRLVDFFFATRPLVLVPAWSFFVLGFGVAQSNPLGPVSFPIARFLFFTFVLVGVYLVNQIVDYESDRINAKGFFLQRGIFSRRQYAVMASLFLVLGLLGAWVRGEGVWLLVTAGAIGLAYSVPPLRFSARPGFDVLANAVGYGGVAFLLGGWDSMGASVLWGTRIAACMFSVGGVFLHTTVLDLDGDRRTGKTSLGLVLGPTRSVRLAALLALVGAGFGVVAQTMAVLAATTVLVVLSLLAVVSPTRVTSRTVVVGGTAVFTIAAGWHEPLFLGLVFVLGLLTRLYYKHRFDLAYPAL